MLSEVGSRLRRAAQNEPEPLRSKLIAVAEQLLTLGVDFSNRAQAILLDVELQIIEAIAEERRNS